METRVGWLLLICFISAFATLFAAQNTAVKKVAGAETQKYAQPGRALGKLENLTGSIATVNDQAQSLTITGADGTPYDFRIGRDTKITIDGQPAAFRDLSQAINKQAAIEFVPTDKGNFTRTIELSSR